MDAEDNLPPKKRAAQFETFKRYVALLNDALPGFWAYQDGIPKLEAMAYGQPLFSEKRTAEIAQIFVGTSEYLKQYNDTVDHFCSRKWRRYVRPMAKEPEKYLIRERAVDSTAIDELINEISTLADSELRSRE